jgi:hypothetical protein
VVRLNLDDGTAKVDAGNRKAPGPGEKGADARKVITANTQKTGPQCTQAGRGTVEDERENGPYDLPYVEVAPDGRGVRASVKRRGRNAAGTTCA